jgi:hypothetical protein
LSRPLQVVLEIDGKGERVVGGGRRRSGAAQNVDRAVWPRHPDETRCGQPGIHHNEGRPLPAYPKPKAPAHLLAGRHGLEWPLSNVAMQQTLTGFQLSSRSTKRIQVTNMRLKGFV